MHAHTFACPECGRRMGVRPERVGRAVRCPYCKKVVVASVSGGPAAAPPPPVTAAADQPPSFEVPAFGNPVRERPDSIFAEGGSDDDAVFEAAPIPANRLEMPEDPPPAEPVPTPPPHLPGRPSDTWARLDDPSHAPPVQPPAPAPPSPPGRWLRLALALVAVYAAAATAAAVWAWFRGGDRGHPLLFVPDTFGEYQPAHRDRVADLRDPLRAMGWDGTTIPPELRVRLGSKLAVGDLLVEPLAVEERRVNRVTVLAGNEAAPAAAPLPQPSLVLTLRLTNTSKDVTFHPTDPAYSRKAVATVPPPLTGVIVGEKARFMGGPVVWPYAVGVKRSYVEGQEADAEPLRPGQTRRAVIVSDADPDLHAALAAATTPVTWQVHLRRGVTRFHRRDVSVGALVGVEFDPQSVKRGE